jgi:general transcription factor 3C polypeptide 2
LQEFFNLNKINIIICSSSSFLHVFYPLQYLAVAAHPPGSSYHKLGMPLIGRGIIQVWCLLSPFEDAHSCQSLNACNTSSRRGRPRKIPDGNNSVGSSSNPPKPRGRPRKIPDGGNGVGSSPNPPKPRGRPRKRPIDLSEPAPKRPRGRPRKNPLPVAKVENSSLNSRSQDIVLFYPLPESTVIPNDLPLAYIMPTVKSTPGRGRGRPRKNPIDKMSGSSGATLTKDVCTVPSPTTVTCMEPKRKRGRPGKYSVPSSIRSISATEMESGKYTTCQALDHTACTESDANLSIVAVDAPLPITSSSATYEDISKGERDRRQNKDEPISSSLSCPVVPSVESWSKRETIPNDPTVSVENALPSGQSNIVSVISELCSVSVLTCEGNVHNGILSDNSVLPNHILIGKKGRGKPRKNPVSAATSFSVVSGANSAKIASAQSDSDNHTALDKSHDKGIVSNLGSFSSCGYIEKCNHHLSTVPPDAASPAHELHNAECKEESRTKRGRVRSRRKHVSTGHGVSADVNDREPKTLTTPKSDDHLALDENCVEGTCSRKGSEQHKKLSASNKNNSMSIGIEACTMDRCSISMAMQTSRSDGMANEAVLIGFKNENVGCEVMKVNEKENVNTSHCNTENGQAKQVSPICQNNSIDEEEAAELLRINESKEDDNKLSSIENSKSYPIPKDIALPRVVLCLAHNGKVAWDIKWKPLIPNQSGQESCLGFLAVLLGNGSLEV